MTRFDACAGLQGGQPFDGEAVARLLRRYGIGPAEQAAVRAFGRIVSAAELATGLLERLNLDDEHAEAGLGRALRGFCRELAGVGQWDFLPGWPAALQSSWSECYLCGAVAEFPFIAVDALIGLCHERLFGERAMVHRLELDIQRALVRLGWCLGGLLATAAVDHEQNSRLAAEDGDPVLGLPNRRRFLALLGDMLPSPQSGQQLGLVVLQVEWGRSVDVLALDERDLLRLAMSEVMHGVLRSKDILCSIRDDEWAVLMPDLRHAAQVSLAGHKLVDACETMRSNSFPALRARFCAGGALAPEQAEAPLALEQAARSALVVAKAGGRPFDLYGGEIAARAEGEAAFETEVARALESQQFQLYLQPQVALPSRRVVGAEALLRWRRPDGRHVSPPEILRVVERIGLTPLLSRWVVQQAAQILATLTARGCDLRVSVNVVADDLNDPELPLFIRQTCDTWRVSPSRLCFEITESGLVSGEAASAETLKLVRQEGGRLALDDFGTGYSSMDYLRRLPLDELKIDKSFVERISASESDRAIVELMVRIAHTFNLEVVAEGVENREAEDALSRMGCDVAQGYLYAPPMPVHEFVDWWARAEAVLAAEHP